MLLVWPSTCFLNVFCLKSRRLRKVNLAYNTSSPPMFALRFGHPLHPCTGDNSHATMDFYSMQLTTLGRHLATSPSLKIKASDSEDVKTAKSEVRSFLGTLEGKVFGRCEWQKVIAFLHSESDMYLRGQR